MKEYISISDFVKTGDKIKYLQARGLIEKLSKGGGTT